MPELENAPSLAGRVALITGASSGLGRHLTEVLAAAGARVVAAARRLDRLQDLAETVARSGGEVAPVAVDVEDEASIVAGFDFAKTRFGTPDIVIANAGVDGAGPSLELEAEILAQLWRVNVQGVYLTAREGARRLIAGGRPERGRIILTGSIAGERPYPGTTAYSASKAAVAMLGKGFAREWARHGINVNTICPGFVSTELNSEWLESEAGQKMVRGFPRRRIMTAQDLDGLVLFLASDASAAVTGGAFTVDDGQVLS